MVQNKHNVRGCIVSNYISPIDSIPMSENNVANCEIKVPRVSSIVGIMIILW